MQFERYTINLSLTVGIEDPAAVLEAARRSHVQGLDEIEATASTEAWRDAVAWALQGLIAEGPLDERLPVDDDVRRLLTLSRANIGVSPAPESF